MTSERGCFSAPNPIKVSTLLPGFGTVTIKITAILVPNFLRHKIGLQRFSAHLDYECEVLQSCLVYSILLQKAPGINFVLQVACIHAQEFWGLNEIATNQFLINSFTPGQSLTVWSVTHWTLSRVKSHLDLSETEDTFEEKEKTPSEIEHFDLFETEDTFEKKKTLGSIWNRRYIYFLDLNWVRRPGKFFGPNSSVSLVVCQKKLSSYTVLAPVVNNVILIFWLEYWISSPSHPEF